MQTSSTPYGQDVRLLAGSRFLINMGYYGVRTVLATYLTVGLSLDQDQQRPYLQLFSGLLFVGTQVLGAVVGDLWLGNKKTAWIGCLIQAIGAFVLCVPGPMAIYLGIVLIGLGGGLHMPNLLALFGQQYRYRTYWMDGGYAFFALALSLSAFLAPLVLGGLGDSNWIAGFAACGVLFAAAAFLVYKSQPALPAEADDLQDLDIHSQVLDRSVATLPASKMGDVNWLYVFGAIVLGSLLSACLEYANRLVFNQSIGSFGSAGHWIDVLSSVLNWFCLGFLAIYWIRSSSTVTMNRFVLGVVMGAVAFVLSFTSNVVLLTFILLVLSEAILGVTVHSILAQYGPSRYSAIIFAIKVVLGYVLSRQVFLNFI